MNSVYFGYAKPIFACHWIAFVGPTARVQNEHGYFNTRTIQKDIFSAVVQTLA